MPARRLLILSYYFPPDPSIGGARWAAMSEWLRRAGHEVTVLTSKSNGRDVEDEPWVLRTFDVGASGSLRRLLRRSPAPPAQALGYVHKPPPRWFTDVVVPDECLLRWCPAALVRARRLVAEREIECVVSSGPPHSTHILAWLLGPHRPAWIADLRDGWRFEALRPPWPTRGQDRLDAALERRTLQAADAVIGVTGPIADDARARLGVRSAHVPNGWSPELAVAGRTDRGVLDRERVNLVYTGTLSGPRGRDPRPLFAAMRQLAAERPAAASRLRVVLAGRLDTDEERLLRTLDLGDAVRHVGSLSRPAAAVLQREADALLLLTGPGHTSEATGKLFEYLAAGRPILALARGNVAARIIAETRTGVTVAPDDVGAVTRVLEDAVDGTLAASYKPHGLERYIYPKPAEETAELIEQAIMRAQAIRGRRARRRVGDTN
jgi:glycosyltransferase involved in cell wall biosynthesis